MSDKSLPKHDKKRTIFDIVDGDFVEIKLLSSNILSV